MDMKNDELLARTLSTILDGKFPSDSNVYVSELSLYSGDFEKIVASNPDKNIVVYGFNKPFAIFSEKEYREAVASNPGRVRYIRMPAKLDELRAVLDKPVYENRALRLHIEKEFKESLPSKLRHDFGHVSLRPEVMRIAKEHYRIEGTEEEVRKQINELEFEDYELSEFLPGAFFDVYGTIVLENGVSERKINEQVVNMIKEYSEEGPVSIWTGSDLERTTRELLMLGFEEGVPVLPKLLYRGCTAETVIDDEEQEAIEEEYGIKAKEFIQVQTSA